MIKRHQEELRALHQKLDLQTDTSLDRFKQTAMVHMHPCLTLSPVFYFYCLNSFGVLSYSNSVATSVVHDIIFK